MTTPAPETPIWARVAQLFEVVPTKWLVTGAAGLAIVSTAAFGGLSDAPVAELPRIEVGETHHGAQLDITPDRAILVDALPEQYFEPEPGNRLLIVTATVLDTWNTPATTLNNVGAGDNLRALGVVDDAPLGVVLLVDGTTTPELQPGVPAQLGWVWEVRSNAFAAGDSVRVDIYDKVYRADGFVTAGERFQEPFLAAFTELEIDDQGAGRNG